MQGIELLFFAEVFEAEQMGEQAAGLWGAYFAVDMADDGVGGFSG